ncbi:alpha,alpha-trehalose-phosphate synthase (UDP-forming) [Thermus thermamylovorans]|uniref:Trehalose-6-phosphate synthase n=1 Tax=Thermus thermamylovorans TaxID=2509362 RepID=A0A4Q9B3U1_9DEIN|nr:trehalose-6-phosphate synthase [Thermus thermamylovorans]TBH20214.1 trehalose-6-phosphate synthase [Thermus thermamylovorans]
MSLIVVANRAPFRLTPEGLAPAVGGLATALLPVLEARGGVWVAAGEWGEKPIAPPRESRVRLLRVPLTEREWQGYYGGFANRVLWPLCHYFLERVELRREHFQDYLRVNRRFAEAVSGAWREGDVVFVQDYHLLLLPGLLRERIRAPIGFFFHIPWPSSGVFRILPWGRALVEGVLGADLVGFHTPEYVENFLRTAAYYGFPVEGNRVRVGERSVRVEAHPLGIDTRRFRELAEDPGVGAHARALRRLAGADRLILGVDRLDYTKGVLERLLAYERLLQSYPHWRGRVAFFQIATPSRTSVAAYRELKRRVDEAAGRILGNFLREDWVPLRYFYQTYSQEELAAFYRAADVAFITPLRDGMNLVALEYAYTAGEGVLVLSSLAGAAEYLKEALLVNPYDLDGMAATLDRALRMPLGERQERLEALKGRVEALEVQGWAERFLASLEG